MTIIDLQGRKRELDPLYVEFLHSVNEDLWNRPDYVGVAPCGSQFKGCTSETSDFDVFLIAGDMTCKEEERLQKRIKSVGRSLGKKAHMVTFWDVDFFEANFELGKSEYSHALWPLAYPFLGKSRELLRLRKLGREKHQWAHKHEPTFASRNRKDAVGDLINHELGVIVTLGTRHVQARVMSFDETSEKIMSRGFSAKELQRIASLRALMWLRRLDRMIQS